jgi:phosphinothricin acetyltransferase
VVIYVSHRLLRQGIGGALYRELLAVLDGQGYRHEVAVITLPNQPSVALHEAFGFERMGTLEGVGYKHERWLDVGFWQRRHLAASGAPRPIVAPDGG